MFFCVRTFENVINAIEFPTLGRVFAWIDNVFNSWFNVGFMYASICPQFQHVFFVLFLRHFITWRLKIWMSWSRKAKHLARFYWCIFYDTQFAHPYIFIYPLAFNCLCRLSCQLQTVSSSWSLSGSTWGGRSTWRRGPRKMPVTGDDNGGPTNLSRSKQKKFVCVHIFFEFNIGILL